VQTVKTFHENYTKYKRKVNAKTVLTGNTTIVQDPNHNRRCRRLTTLNFFFQSRDTMAVLDANRRRPLYFQIF